MLKNKDFKILIIAAAILTVAASVCGYVICGIAAFILLMLLGFGLLCVFTILTKRRYDDIDALNSYLVNVLAGDEAPGILDQEEGELSLLKTNIYKATSTLNYQKELLSKDKVALAGAIADISHQLKTPLTSMIVMNDLLKTEDDKEKRVQFLQTQSNQLNRMNWLIQTLLKLSKIDAGTVTMKPEEVKAEALIQEVIKPFEIQMELKNISYLCKYSADSRYDNPPANGIDIKCDINWTVEALQNIVKNCIEHMDDGGALSINVNDTNIYKEISIEDSGCGIAEEDLPHIFERFYKGKNAGKDSVGIGLALAKTIITGQHGDIIVDSTEGEGTRFSVRFYKTII
ncbi:sensor histidine kinase [Butyrivibrio sp. WCD2001]|uniref:sensor histidine kinase n=1 Tax=Butyrivibrio sp. WCD2001 TaxID=1280681 RepID=UPI0004129BE4|nr:HAMP domain-containing sensor histidine kinase [Butyrivibrio sp. WCD2001]